MMTQRRWFQPRDIVIKATINTYLLFLESSSPRNGCALMIAVSIASFFFFLQNCFFHSLVLDLVLVLVLLLVVVADRPESALPEQQHEQQPHSLFSNPHKKEEMHQPETRRHFIRLCRSQRRQRPREEERKASSNFVSPARLGFDAITLS